MAKTQTKKDEKIPTNLLIYGKHTPFGHYLRKKGVHLQEASAVFGVTPAHISGLSSGLYVPSLKLALRIEDWTDGRVPVQSWIPYFKR